MVTFVQMGNGSASLIESVEYSVLEKLGITYYEHAYTTDLVTLEDTKTRFEGILSIIKKATGDIIAQATIKSRKPFAHAEVSLMDYR